MKKNRTDWHNIIYLHKVVNICSIVKMKSVHYYTINVTTDHLSWLQKKTHISGRHIVAKHSQISKFVHMLRGKWAIIHQRNLVMPMNPCHWFHPIILYVKTGPISLPPQPTPLQTGPISLCIHTPPHPSNKEEPPSNEWKKHLGSLNSLEYW